MKLTVDIIPRWSEPRIRKVCWLTGLNPAVKTWSMPSNGVEYVSAGHVSRGNSVGSVSKVDVRLLNWG